MKLNTIKSLTCAALCIGMITGASAKDNTLSLNNLERERSALINDMLSADLAFEERLAKVQKRQRHLSDMERMVIRDERLMASQSPQVKRAFSAYELTFLVHAGAEKELSASAQWLDQVNFDTASVMSASAGYR
jgi:hypothetical protein